MAENNALWNWGNQQTYHEKIKQEIEKASMGGVDIDEVLSMDSANPVQNKVITEELNKKLEASDLPSTTEILNTSSGNPITLTDAADAPFIGMTLYGNSTQDGTPTRETPVDIVSVGDDGKVGIVSCGKNMLLQTCKTKTTNGVTFTLQTDGSIIMNGTATGDILYDIYLYNDTDTLYFGEEYYTLSFGSDFAKLVENYSDTVLMVLGCMTSGTNKYIIFEPTATKTFRNTQYKNEKKWFVRVRLYTGAVCDNVHIYPQLELGSAATAYEPYKGTTATLTTALPLCSVSDVKDELIFNADGTGKVVKKAPKIAEYAGEEITGNYISSTGELSEGATVIYEAATPEEIDLTAEEVEALKSLVTYKGTTNVFNDEGAEMDIKYWCDESVSALLDTKAEKEHEHLVSDITDFPTSLPASDVADWAKASTKPTYTASEVGADPKGSADNALSSAKSYADTQDATTLSSAKAYTDSEIADLINSAPTTLDTLGEIATAMEENADVVDALEAAVGNKANASDLTSHTSNKSNPHSVTKAQVGLGNVENKSSADIRGELTKTNVTDALGYIPLPESETKNLLIDSLDEVVLKGNATMPDMSDYGKNLMSYDSTNLIVSFEAKSSVDVNIDCYPRSSSGALTSYRKAFSVTTEWKKYTSQITLPANNYVSFTVRSNSSVSGGSNDAEVHIKNLRLEEYIHSDSGVTSGTYRSVTVDEQGHVTAGSNPIITIEQGGTGATTATDALTALGGLSLKNKGTLIPSNSDLNSYTTVGEYCCSSSSIASTLINSPFSQNGFRLIVMAGYTNNYTIQIALGSLSATYMRISSSETEWREWEKITGTRLSDLGVTATATELNFMDGVTSNVQEQLNKKAESSHGTHVSFSTTAPKVAGTAAVGTSTTVSRGDHVHPAQTTISGNAGSATKVYSTNNNSSTGTSYAIPFHSGSEASANVDLLNNHGLRVWIREGTTSKDGITQIIAGNNKVSGAANNQTGNIILYSAGGAYTTLAPSSTTSNISVTLPDSSGTLALTNHTHSYVPLSGGATVTGDIIYTGSMYPQSSGSGSIGTPDAHYYCMYANYLYGTVQTVITGTHSTGNVTIPYETNRTKALIEVWLTTSTTSNRTIYGSALVTGLSDSMTAISSTSVVSTSECAANYAVSTNGVITLTGNSSAKNYRVTWFN